jgi:hypothetical protein
MMNEGPLGENDEKMMREKARTSGFISDFTRCNGNGDGDEDNSWEKLQRS